MTISRPSPVALARFHAGMTVLWFLLIAPSLLWWRESVPWLVLMSVWANFAAHWSAYQGARGEVTQEKS